MIIVVILWIVAAPLLAYAIGFEAGHDKCLKAWRRTQQRQSPAAEETDWRARIEAAEQGHPNTPVNDEWRIAGFPPR